MKQKLFILSKEQRKNILTSIKENQPIVFQSLTYDESLSGKIKEKINIIYHIFTFISEFDTEIGVVIKSKKEDVENFNLRALKLYKSFVIQLIDFQNNQIINNENKEQIYFKGEHLITKLRKDNIDFIKNNFNSVEEFEHLKFLVYKDPLLEKIKTIEEYELIKIYYENVILLFMILGINTHTSKLTNIKENIDKKMVELKIN